MLFPQSKGSETKYACNKNCVLRERRVQILLYVTFYDLSDK